MMKLMMIASYIRKNKEDRRLKRYLKEMAFVRKRCVITPIIIIMIIMIIMIIIMIIIIIIIIIHFSLFKQSCRRNSALYITLNIKSSKKNFENVNKFVK